MSADITKTASRIVYENRWMRVREDAIRRRDGSSGIYGVVDKCDFVVIAPIDAGVVHLVQQYRYPVQGRWWEFPQGIWDERPDANPIEAARGELAEETGLTAASMLQAGKMFTAYGTMNQAFHVFLASVLTAGTARPELEEQDMITRAFALADFEAMIRDGTITDSITVAAFGLLRLKGLM